MSWTGKGREPSEHADAALREDGDYEAFERVLAEAVERTETRLLAYGLLPNHGTWSCNLVKMRNFRGLPDG